MAIVYDLCNAAMKYGLANEEIARKQYEREYSTEVKICGLFVDKDKPFLCASPDGLVVELINAVQTRIHTKAARKEREVNSCRGRKGEEAIIVSWDAEDQILISALQEYVPEFALLKVTREDLIEAQNNGEEVKSLCEQAVSQVQATNKAYSLENGLLVKSRE
ncbi:hypothetical protein TNCV_4301711 [Trichonephila clavipes]|uniref:YqaJ viral recombinase domain-containing protein n=1 Tax=Trichonephila clavipes TaxID=2585209 RepID=A0A8X6RNV1_TRICX|nr:hypothetical protein TNCV_4301711 [Trichonephila clavipes]